MGEDLDERILDGLVGLGDIAEILVGDPQCAPLMGLDQPAEEFARLFHLSPLDQPADVDGQLRVLRDRPDGRTPPANRRASRGVGGGTGGSETKSVSGIIAHRSITNRAEYCLQFTS
jgi:hypothetical protein